MTDWKSLAKKRQGIIRMLERRLDRVEDELRTEKIITSEALKEIRQLRKEIGS